MFKRIFIQLKRIWHMPDISESRYQVLFQNIAELHNRIGEHCEVHADVHMKSESHVVVIGRYKNRDYVRIFGVDAKSLIELIEILKIMEKGSKVGRFDMYGGVPDISVVYPRERL